MDIFDATLRARSMGYTVNRQTTVHGDTQIEVRDKYGLVFRLWDFEPDFEAKLARHVSFLKQQ